MSKRLATWQELSEQEWPNILLGNGFSMNIHSGFSYDYLLPESDLPQQARALFAAVDTTDFETVMRVLAAARVTAEALAIDPDGFQLIYDKIRDALVHAVRDVHVEHADIPPGLLQYVGGALAEYERVFTTNYDLLPYWATMAAGDAGRSRLDDSFRRGTSGRLTWQHDSHDHSNDPSIYYLHGALHLVADLFSGEVWKVEGAGESLLEVLIRSWASKDVTPLFVSEGDSQQKRAAINASEYLRACHNRLLQAEGGIVILGHSLGQSDRHIVQAIRERNRPIAVGVHGAELQVGNQVALFEDNLACANVHYFMSREHPLAIPHLSDRPSNRIWLPPNSRM